MCGRREELLFESGGWRLETESLFTSFDVVTELLELGSTVADGKRGHFFLGDPSQEIKLNGIMSLSSSSFAVQSPRSSYFRYNPQSVIMPAEHSAATQAIVSRCLVSREASGSKLTLSSPTALLSSAPEWQAQFYKTKLCPFYVADIPNAAAAQQTSSQVGHSVGSAGGVCTNRESCRFAHSFSELRPLPDLRKTKLCSSFTKRVPCKNSKCPFAHSPQELRTSSSVFYKVTLCNFYKNGRCWNGANCRFAHGNDELRGAAPSSDAAPPLHHRHRGGGGTTQTSHAKLITTEGLLPTPHHQLTQLPSQLTQLPSQPPTQAPSSSASSQDFFLPSPRQFKQEDDQAILAALVAETLLLTGNHTPPPGFSPKRPPNSNQNQDEDLLNLLCLTAAASEQPLVNSNPNSSASCPSTVPCQSSFSQSTSSSQTETPTLPPAVDSDNALEDLVSLSLKDIFAALSDSLTSTDPAIVQTAPQQLRTDGNSSPPNDQAATFRLLLNLLQGGTDAHQTPS